MSRQDADTFKSRPRANTTTFPTFWRRPNLKPEQPAQSSETALSVEELVVALTPPAVPSIQYARTLSNLLTSLSPLPSHAILIPVLTGLCHSDSPNALQAAGFDILSAYWDNEESPPLSVSERLTYFSFLLASGPTWAGDLWEPRFKAMRSLTKHGAEIIGVELDFIDVCKSWLTSAYAGLSKVERAERAERERSIEMLSNFLNAAMERPEVVSRLSESYVAGVTQFYADLVNSSIDSSHLGMHSQPSFSSESTSATNTPSRSSPKIHKRNRSSVSVTSIPSSPTSSVSPSPMSPYSRALVKEPFDVAVDLYLKHLNSRGKSMSSDHLHTILPVLFRALAFCASPLPRLALPQQKMRIVKTPTEEKITDALNALFSGPYSSVTLGVLKQHLSPPALPGSNEQMSADFAGTELSVTDMLTYLQTSLGAHRTLRIHIRRALHTRLARAYISRESSIGYSHSGAPGHLDLERDLMERAWPKEDAGFNGASHSTGWDPGRLGKMLSSSVDSWVRFSYHPDDPFPLLDHRESIIEEAAGTLRDILQEVDSRDEDSVDLEDVEACAIGETMFNLARFILPLR